MPLEGFCKLTVEARQRDILGAHVLGKYSVAVIPMMASMARIMQRDAHRVGGGAAVGLPDLHGIVTEAIVLAARKLLHELGMVPLAPAVGGIGLLRMKVMNLTVRARTVP